MALLTPQHVPITGLEAVYTAVNASDTIPRRPNLILHVKNADVDLTDVTIVVPGTDFGQANPDVVISVPASEDRFIFLERFRELADPTTEVITVTYSDTVAVTAALLEHE